MSSIALRNFHIIFFITQELQKDYGITVDPFQSKKALGISENYRRSVGEISVDVSGNYRAISESNLEAMCTSLGLDLITHDLSKTTSYSDHLRFIFMSINQILQVYIEFF